MTLAIVEEARIATYETDYILKMLREAADFAEMEGDFQPLRKWLYELDRALEYATIEAEGDDMKITKDDINSLISKPIEAADHYALLREVAMPALADIALSEDMDEDQRKHKALRIYKQLLEALGETE